MQFYGSWKKLPEFENLSKKEYRQTLWSVGLKPFRHWQVWAALLATSLLMLLAIETLFGFLINHSSIEGNWQDALISMGVLPAIFVPRLLYRHFYLKYLRAYITKVSFDPAGSWLKAFVKSTLITFVPFMLIIIGMLGIDWAINYYDEDLDPRFAAIKAWPDPIPENENGFIAFAGLKASIDTSIFEAGKSYVASANEAILKQTTAPTQSYDLGYVGYAAKPKAIDPSKPPGKNAKPAPSDPSAVFCKADNQACWDILRQERNEVNEWLAANKMLLGRYESLKTYPRWQNAILMDRSATILSYQPMTQGQALLQATAMRFIENGQVEKGLELLGNDINFVRRMLAGKDVLIGKMVASSMLAKDLALLAQTLHEFPNDAKKYKGQIEKMLEPLTAQQISVVDAFRFELQWQTSSFEGDAFDTFSIFETGNVSKQAPESLVDNWVRYHFKKNASINLLLNYAEWRDKFIEVHDVNATKPVTSEEFAKSEYKFNDNSWWHFNQIGKVIFSISQPVNFEYANKLFDLNALNNLVRLQFTLIANDVAANDVPAFLESSDRSLWNPETGKPFEWDEKRKQLYFAPATDWFKKRTLIGGVPGRVGLSVH